MDKLREDGYATKKDVLSKINELVEGYNETMKILNDNTEWISNHLDLHVKEKK